MIDSPNFIPVSLSDVYFYPAANGGTTFLHGKENSMGFLGAAKRGGPAVQLQGARPGYTVQLLPSDQLFIDALKSLPGMEALLDYLEDGQHVCQWDGMAIVETPTAVAIICITGHPSSVACAAGGQKLGVADSVVSMMSGFLALINSFQPPPADWLICKLKDCVDIVRSAACRRGGKAGGKAGGQKGGESRRYAATLGGFSLACVQLF